MNDRNMRVMYDGRNPYGSEGGYVVSSRGGRGRGRGRGRRGDRGMDYGYDMRGREYADANYDMARGGRRRGDRGDYGEYDMRRTDYPDMARDMRRDYNEYHNMDGHHMHGGRSGGYEPVEFMGYCSGYYCSPDQDYGRGRDYGYRDYRGGDMGRNYSRGGYDYGDYGDYGETLSDKELEHWKKKLHEQLDEREKQMFSSDSIMQKAKQMGVPMEGFGEKELEVATLMVYTDYKRSIGQNPDLAIKLAIDWLTDKDVAVKGAEKLSVYYDCIVEGE